MVDPDGFAALARFCLVSALLSAALVAGLVREHVTDDKDDRVAAASR